MKAPDKADFRSLAADAAVSFIKEMPPAAQTDYCVFLTRLSRTPKVCTQLLLFETCMTTSVRCNALLSKHMRQPTTQKTRAMTGPCSALVRSRSA